MVSRGMLAVAAVIALLGTSGIAQGNGKYIPEAAYPASPGIPEQRAMVVWRDGVETLVVESAFQTPSPSVAWVLPLPSEPTRLAPGEPGMLTSVSLAMRPTIVHDRRVAWKVFVVWALIAPLAATAILVRGRLARLRVLEVVLAEELILAVLLPALGMAGEAAGSGALVQVSARQRVGIYDVTVLRTESGEKLSQWLTERGLRELDADELEVVNDYVKRGWCFAVARIQRERGGAATPHPIEATFAAPAPIYPMKLTATAHSRTRVELLVLADRQARASAFRCTASDVFRSVPSGSGAYGEIGPHSKAEETGMTIGSPDAAEHLWDGCVVSKLTAELTPDRMNQDVVMELVAANPHREAVISEEHRRDLAMAIAMAGCIVATIAAAAVFRGRRHPSARGLRGLAGIGVASVLTAGVAYLVMPSVPTRTGRELRYGAMYSRIHQLEIAVMQMAGDGLLQAGSSDKEMAEFLRLMAERDYWRGSVDNPLTGEPMRYERSPGNFSTRKVGETVYFCLYDADGLEYRVKLPAELEKKPDEATPG